MTDDKAKALQSTLFSIEKQHGKGAIMRLGDLPEISSDEVISTGCLSLDLALGIGGIPRGRIIEIFGPESSGKTTLALHIVAEAQKNDGICAIIDAEHALDVTYAKALGVDIDELYVSQPDTGEQALDICDHLLRSGALDLIVIDSVAALAPKQELEGEVGDNHVGLLARLMSQSLRRLTAVCNKTRTCLVFINQLRDKVGIVFGSPETTSGGRALKYAASVRLDVRKVELLKGDGESVGNKTRCKVVKNKLAPPFKQADFDIIFGQGISQEGCILDLGIEYGILQKSGSWFYRDGEKLGQGRERSREYLRDHPEIKKEIEERIREEYKKAKENA